MNNIKVSATAIILMAAASMSASRAVAPVQPSQIVTPESVSLVHSGDFLTIDLTMLLDEMKVKSTETVIITPKLVNGTDTAVFNSVGLYGGRSYLYQLRNKGALTGDGETMLRADSKMPATISCAYITPYADWMNGAELVVTCKTFGCCNRPVAEATESVGGFEEFEFVPVYLYMQPKGNAEKNYSLSGSAFIDFPVNKTFIRPDYRNNIRELGKIRGTIDSVKNDKDVTITEIWLKGFASPESPYSHNSDLARGRVAALKEYVQGLYHFPDKVIVTAYEPEDWAGLRRFVENSAIENRDAILEIIDSGIEPDAREAKIKKQFPAEYKFMLENWYPALRHTDYRIAYNVRSYYDPAEIAAVMKETPQKLSLNEFFVLSEYYEPGTDDFNEVFETAVRMYPEDETANLNAAINALQRGDTRKAESYLAKAGNTPLVDYCRGLLAVQREDFPEAAKWLENAAEAGIDEARDALETLRRFKKI